MNRLLLRGPQWGRGILRASPLSHAIPCRAFRPVNRPFASVSCLRSDQPTPPSSEVQAASLEGKEGSTVNSPSNDSPHIPWYLQEESSSADALQTSSRDKLPDLPDNPPAILPTLVDYVFKDLGLDELKIIDSRGLDMPPALGANVIMIIGTARSVKHLNVSADRLCRWLRSTYKLSPYADGLLGRNELKIKLRRKARRARLSSRSGRIFDEKDDGITTGWICVNAGVVEKTPVEKEVDYTFEGFGHTAPGIRVVVQMFTEEKREEVDLESLWQSVLDRAEKKMQKYSEVDSAAPSEEVRASNSIIVSSSDRATRHVPRFPTTPMFEQRRQLHTDRSEPTASASMDTLTRSLSDSSEKQVRVDPGDDSTPSQRNFREPFSSFHAEEKAIAHLNLICSAVSRQDPEYTKQSLYAAFMECTASGFSVSDDLGFSVVSALLAPRPAEKESHRDSREEFDLDQELALRVLDHLSLRGTNVLNMRVLNMIYRAAARAPLPITRDGESSSGVDPVSRVTRIIDALDLPVDPMGARSIMVSFFQHGEYDRFWKLWRKLPFSGIPRTAADYEMLFQLHAELGNELRARECVSTWIPIMNREDPPIPLHGELVQKVKDCLLLADPEIAKKAAKGWKNSLVQHWNQCQDATI